jgi:1-acyl-sn-glycerol-3-phosphate acyltransferase
MGKVLRIIYTTYCFVPFLLSFLVTVPLYFIIFNFFPKSRSPHIAHALSRYWAAYLFICFFIRVKISNKQYIDKNNTYVFVANHLSMLDIPLYAAACKNTFRFLAKEELEHIPLMGYIVRNLYITVKRGDKSDRHRSIEKMENTLSQNISVFLAPEGTRNKSGQPLLEFKEGAFRLAIAAQVPLAILTVHNTHHLLSPADKFLMRPGTLYAEWSEPIITNGMTEADIETLKETTRNIMTKNLQKGIPS